MKYISWFLIANCIITLYCAEQKLISTKTSIYLVRAIAQDQPPIMQTIYPIIVKESTSLQASKIKIK